MRIAQQHWWVNQRVWLQDTKLAGTQRGEIADEMERKREVGVDERVEKFSGGLQVEQGAQVRFVRKSCKRGDSLGLLILTEPRRNSSRDLVGPRNRLVGRELLKICLRPSALDFFFVRSGWNCHLRMFLGRGEYP